MHPTIRYYLAQARMSGLRQAAQRDSVARRSGPGKRGPAVAWWPALGEPLGVTSTPVRSPGIAGPYRSEY